MATTHDFLSLTSIVSALANHLWQSTAFLAAAGLLALVLRKNRARVRYGLWLAASMKFLLPFSLLMAAGSHLAGRWSAPAIGANPGMYAAMDQMSQPFDQMAEWNAPAATNAQQTTAHPQNFHLTLLALAWLAGFLAVLGLRYSQWRRIAKVLRAAAPLIAGREVETLRRMEKIRGQTKPIEMRLSRESLEPGIVGVVSPVLLWPEGISRHLDDAQLEAALAHEICHVRRRDNLTSMLHMLAEAIFWFYPLIWWLEKPLVAERERACDEEVLRLGRQPQTYAEGILKVCEFCVESPLACVSGITGADLKKRIVRIMTASLGEGLSGGRKALLAAAALVAIAVPIVLGQAGGKDFRFEVASIRPADPPTGYEYKSHPLGPQYSPGLYRVEQASLSNLARLAFEIKHGYLIEQPRWMYTDYFTLNATPPNGATEADIPVMLRHLLEDRFGMKYHHETRQMPGYELVVVKPGRGLTQSPAPASQRPKSTGSPIEMKDGMPQFTKDAPTGQLRFGATAEWRGRNATMKQLAGSLADELCGPVMDATGLEGEYDYMLVYTAEPSCGKGVILSPPPPSAGAAPSGNGAPAPQEHPLLRDALKEELGLELRPVKNVPVDVVIIDSVEKAPTGN